MPEKAAGNGVERRRAFLALALVLIILSPLVYSVVLGVSTQGAEPPERPDPKHASCVVDEAKDIRNTRDMRLRHWELLRAVREEVVRYGKRGDVGLGKCGECHTSRERFCYRCHEAASVKPDCWGCHYYP
ncbi:MAG: hypothetical protein ACYTG0_14170 [Planctomycetota bacterium]|jgi:hypothetical protein